MKFSVLLLMFFSINLFAKPLICDGSSYFGLKGYVVIFSDTATEMAQLQVVHGENDLVFETVKMKADYQDSTIINFQGLGERELELSGYINKATQGGLVLYGNQEIKLKNCQ